MNQEIAILLILTRLKLGMNVSQNLIDNARRKDCPRDYSKTLIKLMVDNKLIP